MSFPAMRMVETFDDTVVPSDFNKGQLACNESEYKSEYVLYIW